MNKRGEIAAILRHLAELLESDRQLLNRPYPPVKIALRSVHVDKGTRLIIITDEESSLAECAGVRWLRRSHLK